MPRRYDEETKARAVRLVRDHVGDYDSEWAAITAVAGRLGMSAETLRKWIRQSAVDAAEAPRVSSNAASQIRELKRTLSLSRPLRYSRRRLSSCGSATREIADLPVHRRSMGPGSGSYRPAGRYAPKAARSPRALIGLGSSGAVPPGPCRIYC